MEETEGRQNRSGYRAGERQMGKGESEEAEAGSGTGSKVKGQGCGERAGSKVKG